jgi:hypothetical protein
MQLAWIGAVGRLRRRELCQPLRRVGFDAIFNDAHLHGGQPQRMQGQQIAAISEQLFGMGELACRRGVPGPGLAADEPAYSTLGPRRPRDPSTRACPAQPSGRALPGQDAVRRPDRERTPHR